MEQQETQQDNSVKGGHKSVGTNANTEERTKKKEAKRQDVVKAGRGRRSPIRFY